MDNLKHLRKENSLLQKDVAEYLGCSVNAYSLYERDERRPDPDTLIKIADFFHVSVDFLLDRTSIQSTAEDLIKNGLLSNADLDQINKTKKEHIPDDLESALKMFGVDPHAIEELDKEKYDLIIRNINYILNHK